jgi:sugar O-acyltransferase (sialic acid O-acetyltransferase NeuD family)
MPLAFEVQERWIVVGAGRFARELINWAADAADLGRSPPVSGFLDDSAAALDKFDYGLDYRGTIEDYQPQAHERLLMAIGDPLEKRRVGQLLKARGARFATLVHPSAVVARSARLGDGVVVCPHAVVSADATLGELVAVNALCGVGHDVVVGAWSTLSAQVDLTGAVQVGECCFFGSGARVLPNITVGAEARIGAGAVVMRKVAAGAVMYAAPARKL